MKASRMLITLAALSLACVPKAAERGAAEGERLLSFRELGILVEASWDTSPEEIGVNRDLITRSLEPLSCGQLLSLLKRLEPPSLSWIRVHVALTKRIAACPDEAVYQETLELLSNVDYRFDREFRLALGRATASRTSERIERLRFILLVAGFLEWDFTHESSRRRAALFEKFSSLPIEEVAGKEPANTLRDRGARQWSTSSEWLAPRVLAYVADDRIKKQWAAKCGEWAQESMGAVRSHDFFCLCFALALSMRAEALPLLEEWLEASKKTYDSLRFGYHDCVRAIGFVPGEKALGILGRELSSTGNYYEVEAILRALLARPERDALTTLKEFYEKRKDDGRQLLLRVMSYSPLGDYDDEARAFFAKVARETPGTHARMAPLTVFTGDAKEVGNAQMRRAAAGVFGQLGPKYHEDLMALLRAIPMDKAGLVDAGIDTPPVYAEDAIILECARNCGKKAENESLRLLKHKEEVVRYRALQALKMIGSTAHLDQITPLLHDESTRIRVEAATCLAENSVRTAGVQEVLAAALSPKKELREWIGGAAWGECDIEQFGPATRAYHSLGAQAAEQALLAILAASLPERKGNGFVLVPVPTAWEQAYPLYVELTGKEDAVSWEYLRYSTDMCRETLSELQGRRPVPKERARLVPTIPPQYAEMSGKELVRRLKDENTRMFAFYELTRRNQPDEWRWLNLAHFMKDHWDLELIVCPQHGGEPALSVVLYEFLKEGTDPGHHGGLFEYWFHPKVPEVWKRQAAFTIFGADGEIIPMPQGNNMLHPGVLRDINGDGLVECVNCLPASLEGSEEGKRIRVDVLMVHLVSREMRPLLFVALNWWANYDWGFDLFDDDADGVFEIAVGPRSDDELKAEAVYRWDAETKQYVGPKGAKGDLFHRLDPEDVWSGLERLKKAGGLPLP